MARTTETSNLKSASAIIKETTVAMRDLAPIYERIGLSGTFTLATVILAVLVVLLSFLSGRPEAGTWETGITLQEEILFVVMLVTLAILATVFAVQKNRRQAELKLAALAIEKERNRWLHEETMARLAARIEPQAKDHAGHNSRPET